MTAHVDLQTGIALRLDEASNNLRSRVERPLRNDKAELQRRFFMVGFLSNNHVFRQSLFFFPLPFFRKALASSGIEITERPKRHKTPVEVRIGAFSNCSLMSFCVNQPVSLNRPVGAWLNLKIDPSMAVFTMHSEAFATAMPD